jgi:hypothetical protein
MVKDEEKHRTTFDSIGERWRESVDKVKEYEIIEGEEEDYGEFVPSITFDVYHQECLRAEKLKQRLLKKYNGKKLEDVIGGEEFNTKKGVCYRIETQDKINLKVINPDQAKKKMLSDLKLIYGVGEAKERILKKDGYKTIEDLTDHPRFSSEAKRFLNSMAEPLIYLMSERD